MRSGGNAGPRLWQKLAARDTKGIASTTCLQKRRAMLERRYNRRIAGVALRDDEPKSYLPSLLRRGSKLASSSWERVDMSAMVTTGALCSGRVECKRRRNRMFRR